VDGVVGNVVEVGGQSVVDVVDDDVVDDPPLTAHGSVVVEVVLDDDVELVDDDVEDESDDVDDVDGDEVEGATLDGSSPSPVYDAGVTAIPSGTSDPSGDRAPA
jgi:hypothetical protein